MSTLSQKVRNILSERGITPTQAARSVGLPSGFITDILTGRKNGVQDRNLEKLATALGCEVGFLVNQNTLRPELIDAPAVEAGNKADVGLRDEIAVKVLIGLIAHQVMQWTTIQHAELAYAFADAMLAARGRGK